MTLAQYIEILRSDGVIVDTARMNPPPEDGLDVAVELYQKPEPFAELFGGGQLVARVNIERR